MCCRCSSGIEGLRDQGVTNEIVCKFLNEYTSLFGQLTEPGPFTVPHIHQVSGYTRNGCDLHVWTGYIYARLGSFIVTQPYYQTSSKPPECSRQQHYSEVRHMWGLCDEKEIYVCVTTA